MKKLTFLAALFILGLSFTSCQGKKADDSSDKAAASAPAAPAATDAVAAAEVPVNAEGKKIFETYCMLCHGMDGKLGLNGSKDLSISTISLPERITQVTNGKGLMTPFKEILTEAEIKAVAGYTMSLKK